jgi:NDP-sugar pyrophosphorylase family protein
MKTENDYEKAFSRWLAGHNYSFNHVSQTDRLKVGNTSVKSFDYVIEAGSKVYVVELKGRLFRGNSFESFRGLQNWVTRDDIRSLCGWRSIEGIDGAFIVFAYKTLDYCADADGNDCVEFEGSRYVFAAVAVKDYEKWMKIRSPKWGTVNLSADDFRRCVRKVSEVLSD